MTDPEDFPVASQRSGVLPEPLRAKIDGFPTTPGVYIMKDRKSRVLYVGKAKNLKARVRSYLSVDPSERPMVSAMAGKVRDVDFIVTRSDKEALIIENSLIKHHQPKHNLRLKDDKNYLCLRVDLKKDFPRIDIVRRSEPDGARYFGPYSSAAAVRETVKLVERTFGLRSCTDYVHEHRRKPCFYFHLGHCPGTCVGLVTPEEYRKSLRQGLLFLEGRNRELLRELHGRMDEAAAREDYEEAARLRDRARAVEATVARQSITFSPDLDCDAVGLFRSTPLLFVQVLRVRRGRIVDSRGFLIQASMAEDEDPIGFILLQYYDGGQEIPPEVLLQQEPRESDILQEILSERRGAPARVLVPQRGPKRNLIAMAEESAKASLAVELESALGDEGVLRDLQSVLGMETLPRRIECYDISNTQGSNPVGSRVVFVGGRPYKKAYRQYHIRDVAGPDDPGMMREVLRRRFEREGKEERPDLIVMDGGPGQLAAAVAEVPAGAPAPALISLAKGRASPNPWETVYVAGSPDSIPLRDSTPGILLLKRIRDEAHRFAIRHHRSLRSKSALISALDSIPGVGPKRRSALLRHFGSVKAIAEADAAAVAAVKGIPAELAGEIHARMRQAFAASKP